MEIEGYDKLSEGQQKSFEKILRLYLLAQSTESLKQTELKAVAPLGRCFRLDMKCGDSPVKSIVLNPVTLEWG